MQTTSKSNFVKKVFGSVVENGNKASYTWGATSLLPPNSGQTDFPQSHLDSIMTLDGNSSTAGKQTVNGVINQQLFSFDVIRILTDRFGNSIWNGATTLVDKVARAKVVIGTTGVNAQWYGYGSSPTGNKANLRIWGNSTWNGTVNHTNNFVTQIGWTVLSSSNYLQDDGFIYVLAYADPSDGVTASTINTDYVELILAVTLNSTVQSDFKGEYPSDGKGNVYKARTNETFGNPTIANDFAERDQNAYSKASVLDGNVNTTSTPVNAYIAQELFSFNILDILEKKYGSSIWKGVTTVAEKVAIAKGLVTAFTFNWWGFGSSPTGNMARISLWGSSWEDKGGVNTGTVSQLTYKNNTPAGVNFYIQNDGMIHILANALASNGTIASVINTDYIELVLETTLTSNDEGVNRSLLVALRQEYPSYNVGGIYPHSKDGTKGQRIVFYSVPSSKLTIETNANIDLSNYELQNRWFQGMQLSGTNLNPSNFVGKVAGNGKGNVAKYNSSASLSVPSDSFWTEDIQGYYTTVSVLDGSLHSTSTAINPRMSQQLFSFNILDILEKKFGARVWQGKTLLADKVAIAGGLVKAMVINWYGYGSSPLGNKATMNYWEDTTKQWVNPVSHTVGTVTKLTSTIPTAYVPSHYWDVSGMFHVIVNADASNGTVASVINTDYVELVLTL